MNEDKRKDYKKRWYLMHRESILLKRKQWREQNKELVSAYNKEYYQEKIKPKKTKPKKEKTKKDFKIDF
jgi:hypothetical protein